MIRLLTKVPNEIYIACSGGPDSMAALDFLRRSDRSIAVCYFNHGTPHGESAHKFVATYCAEHKLSLEVGYPQRKKGKGESLEEYWRNERLRFFHTLKMPIVTGHTLDDVCEWWIFTALNGIPRLIPSQNGNILRPFLLTQKKVLLNWCLKKGVEFLNDPSNISDKFMRSFIRKNMMPAALYVNPGFYKVVSKKLIDETSHPKVGTAYKVSTPRASESTTYIHHREDLGGEDDIDLQAPSSIRLEQAAHNR